MPSARAHSGSEELPLTFQSHSRKSGHDEDDDDDGDGDGAMVLVFIPAAMACGTAVKLFDAGVEPSGLGRKTGGRRRAFHRRGEPSTFLATPYRSAAST